MHPLICFYTSKVFKGDVCSLLISPINFFTSKIDIGGEEEEGGGEEEKGDEDFLRKISL